MPEDRLENNVELCDKSVKWRKYNECGSGKL